MTASKATGAFWPDDVRWKVDNGRVRVLANHHEWINSEASFVIGLHAVRSGALRQSAADSVDLPVHHCNVMATFFIRGARFAFGGFSEGAKILISNFFDPQACDN